MTRAASIKHGARRPIRSYVVRGGRLTPSQQKAMDHYWPEYGLELDQVVFRPLEIFGRDAPLVFEIGFGMGDSLVTMAQQHPEWDFIGIDVHPPGIGTILRDIAESGLSNLRVCQGDASVVLRENFAPGSLDRIQIFFPDPWHKKKHHKRRLIQAGFVQELRTRLKPGGVLHIATDWENYAEHIMEVMARAEGYENCFGAGQLATRHPRPETKFERRGRRLGHDVWDMIFRRVS